jgi:hypothetical protein
MLLKNRESPAKRDLRFAPTSFRTPKLFCFEDFGEI